MESFVNFHFLETTLSVQGDRQIFVGEAMYDDNSDASSRQLSWVISRMDYIANKVGVKWAASVSRFLKGEFRVYYDLGRS